MRAAASIAAQVRDRTLEIITMDLQATNNHTFHPIECIKMQDNSWKHTPTTIKRTL